VKFPETVLGDPVELQRAVEELERQLEERNAELKRAQGLQSGTEQRLALALAATGSFAWEYDLRNKRVTCSPSAKDVLGFAPPAHGEAGFLMIHPEDRERVSHEYRAGLVAWQEFRTEFRLTDPQTGAPVWLRADGRFFRRNGEAERLIGIAQNVTALRIAEFKSREREALLSGINDAARVGISLYDLASGNTLYCNRYSESLLGFPLDELYAMRQSEHFRRVHPDDKEIVYASVEACRRQAGGEASAAEYRYRRRSGEYVWLRTSLTAFSRDRHGQVAQMLCVMNDITQARRAQEELLQAREELEIRVRERTEQLDTTNRALRQQMEERTNAEAERQEVLNRVLAAQEEERRRISRELHDDIGQYLTALMLGLKTLEQQMGGMVGTKLQELEAITEMVGKEVHDVALGLRPTALDDLGLVDALSAYVEDWSVRVGLQVDFHASGFGATRLPGAIETALYRITQEALNNIAKHAGATRVSLILERKAARVLAIIEDNGTGFDVESLEKPSSRRHLGFRGMKERAALIDGELRVESSLGQGTTLFVQIPIPGEKSEKK
jgi:PAS domain S-box-containing protein